jgi:hypothetical protein
MSHAPTVVSACAAFWRLSRPREYWPPRLIFIDGTRGFVTVGSLLACLADCVMRELMFDGGARLGE